MPLNQYTVEVIQPEWALEPEKMGSKEKFWYRRQRPGKQPDRLFKRPNPGTGEHWAEKITAEVAKLLPIPCARVTLATYQDDRGSSSWSFVKSHQSLFHGNQILAGTVGRYDPDLKFHQSDHTLENVFLALDSIFVNREDQLTTKKRIADYFVFDALIGNTDRHHENWGLLIESVEGEQKGEVAPTFDHATSLGRELVDFGPGKCRNRLLEEERVGTYSEKARGAVFWSSDERHAPSPLELIRRAAPEFPDLFSGSLQKLTKLQPSAIEDCVMRVPDDWMSPLAKQFAIALMRYNISELEMIVP